ncbi:MAG TPA: hypothetical protein VMT11_19125 [Myxococcaceae bacterium]|nr:hypothetical protein [Myxococcaceae bacterium]
MRHALPIVVVALLSHVAIAEEELGDNDIRKRADFAPGQQRPGNGGWMFADSSQLPGQLQAAVISRFTYNGSGNPARPFASNLGSPGGMGEIGGEIGLTDWMAVQAIGVLGRDYVTNGGSTGATAGLRFGLFPRAWKNVQMVLNGGWVHELSGGNGAYGRLQLGLEFGRFRGQVSTHVEHIFATGRDPVDVMLTAGASMRVLSWLRLGAEYVGQDLEGEFDPAEAEGGPRHLLGPTIALTFMDERLSIVGGPAFEIGGLNPGSVMARAGISYAF